MLIDAHGHLDKYPDDDIDGVIEAIEQHRILTLSVSVDVASFLRTERIAKQSSLVVPAFGIHPSEASRYVDSLTDIEEFVERSPLSGEIGLDHRFVTDTSQYVAQRTVFDRFLTWAVDQDKLVNVHCAGAEQDTAGMLAEHRIDRAIIHWYSGPLDVLAELIDQGFMFTVGVEVLHSDHIRDVARAIPADQLLTETDNPGGQRWLTGRTGYPALLVEILDELALVRGISSQDLRESVQSNLTRLIQDDPHLRPWLTQLQSEVGKQP